MQLVDLTPNDQDVINVFSDIDRLINSLYPVATAQSLSVEELGQPNVYAIGLKNEDGIVACGAIVKQFDTVPYGEIRRLYVKPSYRGKGLSRRIMQILLHHAGEEQIPLIRLETGPKQKKSISLYENLGFQHCGPFGSYTENPQSLFMELGLNQ
ncbi:MULTISPECIES: GNAT family N-acetyltransferase [Pseudoalteromonas]|uniref:GNAT family N-acetyltransferase n=1 Tax=Pseudoalteromonas haloplanktis TaxID=228 RepID=A0ABU1BET3_PSEHA|nr:MULTISPECIES: GNAT family N-acetyltransferase [Pseudoalteromonas]MCF6145309.1 putative acetyltransferase [Pseudoalteromonas mariniglutinosa NCIMB 1770]MDQ9092825.1 GNAT family N-acetyltransferase [Pseudoalteromonas haloplanktis]TMN70302.1 N-acetyltransferase [Pseudoalteromonas sp. S1727]BDF94841.1 N-acetyltransferase [Pseudoalteromonas sp. KAN5]